MTDPKEAGLTGFGSVEEAIDDLQAGKMLIVVDDEDRENEGDLVLPAEHATAKAINFMLRHGRGLICVPLTAARCDELRLPPMTAENTAKHGSAFTVSVDARDGGTGTSASDRARTIRILAGEGGPGELVRPGHVFPLRAAPGGVLERNGHTEAVVDLLRLAGLRPAGVVCEILREDGAMARLPELGRLARRFGLRILPVESLVRYRLRTERLVRRSAGARLPTEEGEFTAFTYSSTVDGAHHLALVKGTVDAGAPVLVRIHSECLTGEVFGSLRCDCREQLHAALQKIEQEGRGVLVYLRQEGRGIGLEAKIKAYALQDRGSDTVEANELLGFPPDLRDYGVGAQILTDLGVSTVRLLTNNPRKQAGLEEYGIQVVERVPLEAVPNRENYAYLRAKRDRLRHLLSLR